MIIYGLLNLLYGAINFVLGIVPDLPMDGLVDVGIISEYMGVMTDYIRTGVGILRYVYGSRLLDFTFGAAVTLTIFDVGMVAFRFVIGKFFMK